MLSYTNKYGQWALVTGGSTGIGLALAKQAASCGMDIILVARRAGLLAQAQEVIQGKYKVKVKVIELDLTADAALDKLFEETKSLEVGMLVPNAGIELNGLFINTSMEANRKLLRLNSEMPMALTHHYGRMMAARNKGAILLVSSGFGYQATPYIANYAATKAYILALGEALNVELKEYGVDVTVLSPGLTKTSMTDDSTINFKKLPVFSMAPDVVARIGFKALGRKASVIAGFLNKFYVWQNRFVPRSVPVKLFGILVRRAIRKEKRFELLSVSAGVRS
jgi:hypothetical protein